jgi:hypothetical protein
VCVCEQCGLEERKIDPRVIQRGATRCDGKPGGGRERVTWEHNCQDASCGRKTHARPSPSTPRPQISLLLPDCPRRQQRGAGSVLCPTASECSRISGVAYHCTEASSAQGHCPQEPAKCRRCPVVPTPSQTLKHSDYSSFRGLFCKKSFDSKFHSPAS